MAASLLAIAPRLTQSMQREKRNKPAGRSGYENACVRLQTELMTHHGAEFVRQETRTAQPVPFPWPS